MPPNPLHVFTIQDDKNERIQTADQGKPFFASTLPEARLAGLPSLVATRMSSARAGDKRVRALEPPRSDTTSSDWGGLQTVSAVKQFPEATAVPPTKKRRPCQLLFRDPLPGLFHARSRHGYVIMILQACNEVFHVHLRDDTVLADRH